MKKKQLTVRQLEYITLVCESPQSLSDEEVTRLLRVRKATLARWKSSAFIREEINRRIRDRTEERMPQVWTTLLDKAESGDVAAMKLLFQVRGELLDQSNEAKNAPPPEVKLIVKSR